MLPDPSRSHAAGLIAGLALVGLAAAGLSGCAAAPGDFARPATSADETWVLQIAPETTAPEQRARSLAQGDLILDENAQEEAAAIVRPAPVDWRVTDQFLSDGPPPAARETFLNEERLAVRMIGRGGEVLHEQTIADPSRVRAEFFQTRAGRVVDASHGFVERSTGFPLALPYLPETRRIEFYRPVWTGTRYEEKLTQTVVPPPAAPRRKGAGREFLEQSAENNTVRERRAGPARIPTPRLTTLVSNGDSSKKADLILIGDGYTAAQMNAWRRDAAKMLAEMQAANPFCMFEDYFNVHRIDVAGAESGAGYGRPWSKQNALGSYLGCAGNDRLLCVDYAHAMRVIQSVTRPDQRDIIITLVNDPRYGGSGGAIAAATVRGGGYPVVAHELGHSFAGLADEYEYGGHTCNQRLEPPAPNVTAESDARNAKWSDYASDAGHYEGAYYCPRGYYRPYESSRMRDIHAPWRALHMQVWYERLSAVGDGEVNLNCSVN